MVFMLDGISPSSCGATTHLFFSSHECLGRSHKYFVQGRRSIRTERKDHSYREAGPFVQRGRTIRTGRQDHSDRQEGPIWDADIVI